MIPVRSILRTIREAQEAGEPGSTALAAIFYGACVALIITFAWIILP